MVIQLGRGSKQRNGDPESLPILESDGKEVYCGQEVWSHSFQKQFKCPVVEAYAGGGGGLFNPNCLGPEKSMLEQNGALDGKLGKLFIN